MVLRITQGQTDAVRQHGARDYPSECCGALLGKVDGEAKQVMEVAALKNLRHNPSYAQELLPVDDLARETERNRFLIDPLEQLRMEKDARAPGWMCWDTTTHIRITPPGLQFMTASTPGRGILRSSFLWSGALRKT